MDDTKLTEILTEIIARLRAIEKDMYGMHYDEAKEKVSQMREKIIADVKQGEELDIISLLGPDIEKALQKLREVHNLRPSTL